MKAKFERRLLVVGPCIACLLLAVLPSISAKEPKPPVKIFDMQGTWNLVSWEKDGKEQERRNVRFFITEPRIHAEGVPGPDRENFGTWSYDLGAGDKPNLATLTLSAYQGRELAPGLCELDGATLRIVLGRLLPRSKAEVDRPKEFATRPGTGQLLFVLKRADAADDPIAHLRKLGGEGTITRWGSIYLDTEKATNDDLALIKKLPVIADLTLRRCRITDAGLAHLKDMAHLRYLALSDMPITDEGLAHLEGMPRLTDLSVSCAKVSGAGLKRLTGLTTLDLPDSAFTDADLVHLQGLTRLERLDLSKTAITDAGLAHLKPLVNLDRLFLENTRVTDAGLEHLRGLTRLRVLRVEGTKVTDKGVRALKAALPNLKDVVR
jgi:hypothetical protein